MARIWIFAILLLSGCAGIIPMHESKGKKMLDVGIQHYEDGDYANAVSEIQAALKAGLADSSDQVKAHKFLAFTYCVTDRQTLCGDEFKKARAIDPKFNLAPAEAGHPIWGPVFRDVKGDAK